MLQKVTHSPDQTRRLGAWLGERLRPGDFVALVGEMGAGKTHLSAGILAGLSVTRTGGSPTFTLLWEYQGRLPVYHWDVYRLVDPRELEDLGYEEYFYGNGVNIVEWADQVQELWPTERLRIDLKYGVGNDDRVLALSGTARYTDLLKELQDADFGL
jgi:tRNA threonylcarbamoyladenosine biosynthesis protein TsaE